MKSQVKALQDIDKAHYGYLKAIYMSFYSALLYVDVGKRWKGLGLLYLFIMVTLFVIPFAWRVSLDFRSYFQQQITAIQSLPPLTIEKGKLVFDKPMPYFIKNDKGQDIIVIDTTGKMKHKDKNFPYLSILVTEKAITYWPPSIKFYFTQDASPMQPITYPFKQDASEVLNGKLWIETSGIKTAQNVVALIIYPLMTALCYALFAMFLLAFTMMAQLFANLFFKFKLRYGQACRLLIVASTVPIFLFMITIAFNRVFVGMGLVLLIVLAIYFSYAVLCLKRESNKMVHM